MADYQSNIDDLGAWLDDLIDEIGWDMPAPDGQGTLGHEAVDVLIDGQQARARTQYGLDSRWDENTDQYRSEKAKLYGDQPPNSRTEQMLGRDSMRGRQDIGHLEAGWTYGTGDPPGSGKTRRDRTTPDTDKAFYAHEGQSERKVKREFFGITDQDADDALLAVDQAIVAHIERKAAT